mgnify:CR=1 FL=1|jgi:hypothetical protein
MTNNNATQEATMNEIAEAAAKRILSVSSEFVIDLAIVDLLVAAGQQVSTENIDKIREMINI